MSRKHKSNRKQKITQSNVPAPFSNKKEQVKQNPESQTLPETNTSETENAVESTPISSKDEKNTPTTQPEHTQNHSNATEEDSGYTLDEHYAQQEKDDHSGSLHHETTSENTNENVAENLNVSAAAASLNEYEQLKRKNRRRLVGAGALVLVAGSLFAAASKDNNQTPQLTAVKPVETVVHTEILRPAGSENKIDLSMDNEKSAPLVLKNNAIGNNQPQANRVNKTTTPAPAPKNTVPASTQSNEDKTKTREKARLAEERRQKVQSKVAEAEAKRLETERTVANKAKNAQAAADRNRNAERAQLTVERAAEEKQRAQRQAASSKSSGGKSSIQAGAFADKDAARRMQQQLKDLNYSARLEEVQTSKGKIYRVRTGNFANENEARSALNKLQNKGVNGMLVGK